MNALEFHCISRQKNIYGSNYNIITFLDILYQFTNIYDELSILWLVGGLLLYVNLSLLFKAGSNIFSKIAENSTIYISLSFFDIFHKIIVLFQTFPITPFLPLLSPSYFIDIFVCPPQDPFWKTPILPLNNRGIQLLIFF